MHRIIRMVALTSLLTAVFVPGVGATEPGLTVGESQVVATGLTPGGRVAWLGFARERAGWVTSVFHWEDLAASADATGQATLDLGRATPIKAVFVVVDVTTGAFAAASPADYPWATELPFPSSGMGLASDRNSVASLRDDHNQLEVLVVRPRQGAWRATVSHDDAPATNQAQANVPGVVVGFAELTPWGNGPAGPGSLRPGDVVVAIDPGTIEYFAGQLSGRF